MRPGRRIPQRLPAPLLLLAALPSKKLTLESPSEARICVATRSRNQRSWLMTMTVRAKLSRPASPARAGGSGGWEHRVGGRSGAEPPATDGVDVEVAGGLVEEQDVGAGLEHARQVHAVALAPGERCQLRCGRGRRAHEPTRDRTSSTNSTAFSKMARASASVMRPATS